MRYIAIVLFFSTINLFSQIAPSEIPGIFQELNDLNDNFNGTVLTGRQISNDLLGDSEFPEDELESEFENVMEEFESAIQEFYKYFHFHYDQIEESKKTILKAKEFMPRRGKELLKAYNQTLVYLDNIKTGFEKRTFDFTIHLKSNFAKSKLSSELPNALLLPNNPSFKDFLKEMESSRMEYIFDYVFYDGNGSTYKNHMKFMKKFKLDSLLGYYSSETTNIYIGRHYETGLLGLYEIDYHFESKSTREILKTEFDSIQTDIYYGRDLGEPHWSTAVAWKSGSAMVVEKDFLDPDFEYDYDEYDFKITTSKHENIVFPDPKYGLVYGNLAIQTDNGNWVIIDVDQDTSLSPEYPSRITIPGVNKKNEILTFYSDRNVVTYHGNNKVDRYVEGNTFRRYHGNGQLMMEENRVPRGDTYDGTIIIYNREGELFGKGSLKDKEISEFNMYYSTGEIRRKLMAKDSILWDTVYYANGQIHSCGIQSIPRNNGGIKMDYYDDLGVKRPIFYFDDHYKDSIWTYYYASGKLRSKGKFKRDEKVGNWEYYSPLGIKSSDGRFRLNNKTDMIFPFRLSRKDSIAGFYSKTYNRALLYDHRYNPPIFELWDVEKNRQLKPPFNIPLDIPYTNYGFIGKNILVGGSLDGDVPECYDLEKEVNFPVPDNYEEAENKRVYSSKSQFNIKRKLNIRKVQFENNELIMSSDSGKVFGIHLATGHFKKRNEGISRVDLDTLIDRGFEHQVDYYVNYFPEDGYLITYTGSEDYESVLVDNTPFGKQIELYYHYGIGRLTFQNKFNDIPLEQFVKLEINEEGEYIFYTLDNYYMGSKNLRDLVFFKQGEKYYEFEQFDLKYNRPDIVLHRLGYADSSLVQAYYKAYQKRLRKMGFTEEMLKDDFHIPELKIENFEEMPTLTGENQIELNLKMKDDLYDLDRINIWINDVAVYGSNGISLRNKNVNEYAQKIQLDLAKGNNKIQVSVLNQAGAESYKETIEIECTKGKAKPNLYLITIGESKFQQSEFNLTYAAKDAQDIAELFTKSKVFENVYTKTLVNEEVTKANIHQLKAFLRDSDINDEVMIFIAGHGVLDDELDYYFASYDMDFQNPSENGIAYADLESLLDGIKPLKKTLLIYACHSGEIDKDEVELIANNTKEDGDIQFRAVGKTAAPKLGMQNTSELSKSLFTDLRKGTGATVISSAGGMEFAMEGADWNNGLFTYCLLNGIRSKEADLNGDKEIWLSELQQYIQEKVFELSKGQQKPTSRIENQTVDFRVW